MPVTHQEVESQAIELSAEAFEAFCEDISGMFNVDMACSKQEVCTETVAGFKKRFKKLVAVNSVKTDGALNGTFHLVFDQGGLFTLSGVIVMLPENRILEEIKRGTIKDVESMNDAIKEAGNLLVGAWDKVFRKELEGHGHFVQTNTYIGAPWDNPQETLGLSNDEKYIFVPYEMTISSYPAFSCGVIFSPKIFKPQSESLTEKNDHTEENPQRKNIVNSEKDTLRNEDISEKNKIASDISSAGEVSNSHKQATTSSAALSEQSAQISLYKCAKDIMETEVVWCSPDESVEQALTKMQKHNAGYLLVGTTDQLEGIVSRSDITGAISPYLRSIFSKWRRPIDDATLKIRLKWIMSRPVHTIKPDTSVISITDILCQLGCRCLPVVTQNGKVEGLVTVFDIFKILNNGLNISTVGKTLQVPPLI